MENSAVPDLEKNGADEAVLEALLKDAKESDANKTSGEAALEALIAKADQQVSQKKAVSEVDSQERVKALERQKIAEKRERMKEIRRTSVPEDVIDFSDEPETLEELRKTRIEKRAAVKAEMLIVHADITQLSVLEMSFISEGYKVVIFETGKEALHYLKENVPDIMLLDADMEKLTGMDICFRIRKIKRFAKVPVIIMTESTDDRTETMIKMCHANDFFPKTSKNIELKAKVRKLLDTSDMEKLTQAED